MSSTDREDGYQRRAICALNIAIFIGCHVWYHLSDGRIIRVICNIPNRIGLTLISTWATARLVKVVSDFVRRGRPSGNTGLGIRSSHEHHHFEFNAMVGNLLTTVNQDKGQACAIVVVTSIEPHEARRRRETRFTI